GPGSFSRRILRRLGAGGLLVGVDCSEGLLIQAQSALADAGPARFEPVLADIASLGSWLCPSGPPADVVVGPHVLHPLPIVVVGRSRTLLAAGTGVGFFEPDFRTLLARLSYLEAGGRPELVPLRVWAVAINHLYEASRLSPDVGATLAASLQAAGYRNVRHHW